MTTQAARAETFRELHRSGTFVIPNPWDAGTARLLAHLGFPALASTSMGYAFSTGRRDTAVSRDEMLTHVATLAGATVLPVSADLENGYGDSPAACAETIRLSAEAGVVGGSVEDATGDPGDPGHHPHRAAARGAAAVRAAPPVPVPHTPPPPPGNHP